MLHHSRQKPTVAGRAWRTRPMFLSVLQDSLGFPCPASVLRLDRTLLLENYSVSDRCLFCKVSLSRGLRKFLTYSCVPSFPSCVGRRPLADCVHIFLRCTLLSYYHFASRLADEELCPSALRRRRRQEAPKIPWVCGISCRGNSSVLLWISCTYTSLLLCQVSHISNSCSSHSNTQTDAILLLLLRVSGL